MKFNRPLHNGSITPPKYRIRIQIGIRGELLRALALYFLGRRFRILIDNEWKTISTFAFHVRPFFAVVRAKFPSLFKLVSKGDRNVLAGVYERMACTVNERTLTF